MVTPGVLAEPVHTLCLTRAAIWYRVVPEPKPLSASAVSHAWTSATFQPIELLKLEGLSPLHAEATRLPVVHAAGAGREPHDGRHVDHVAGPGL